MILWHSSLVFDTVLWYDKSMKNVKISRDLASLSREELEQQVMKLSTQVDELSSKLSWYEEQYRLSRAQRFGPSSEQTAPFEQMSFFNEAESESSAFVISEPDLNEVKAARKTKQKGHKDKITKPLPAEIIEYRLSAEDMACPQCGEMLHEMKKEIRKELKVIPAQVMVTEHVRYVYACRNCEKNGIATPIVSAPMPNPAIKNSLASPSMLAHIMTRKYVEAIPLYRQEQQFKRFGINLSRQTLANWVIKASSSWLMPLYEAMHRELLTKEILHADETVLEVLCEPGREPSAQSYMWLYRTGRDDTSIVLYEYTQGRSGDYAKKFLDGFSGYIHTDGYAGYHKLAENPEPESGGITLVGCWAHARRKYDEALKAVGPKSAAAALTICQGREYCDQLFKIEEGIKVLPPAERTRRRLKEAKPLLEAYFAWAERNEPAVLPKSKLGDAISYSLKQRKYLENYLLDGRLEISNNRAERSIKPFVIGRKNWLFSNTPKGADASAVIYSLIETAKENDLNPFPYLQYLFEQLPNVDIQDPEILKKYLPWSKDLPQICRNLQQ
jgi:transposase